MTSWMARGTCKTENHPTNVFFPEDDETPHAAKAVCRRCPVRQECETYARTHQIFHGVWGGLNERGRTRRRTTPSSKKMRPAKTPWGQTARDLLATDGWFTVQDVADAIAPVVAESRLLSEDNQRRRRYGRPERSQLTAETRKQMTYMVASTLVANMRKRAWLDEPKPGVFRLKEETE